MSVMLRHIRLIERIIFLKETDFDMLSAFTQTTFTAKIHTMKLVMQHTFLLFNRQTSRLFDSGSGCQLNYGGSRITSKTLL